MNDGLKGVLIFAVGAATGGITVWFAMNEKCREKYAKIADEEIASVKKVFSSNESKSEPREPVVAAQNKADILSYREIVGQSYESESLPLDDSESDNSAAIFELPNRNLNAEPYVISPDDFGSEIGYDTITLSYYADGVLADDLDEPVMDIDDIIGSDALEHFGEYADDALFVRNEKYRADYEILRDLRKYSDVVGRDYPTED